MLPTGIYLLYYPNAEPEEVTIITDEEGEALYTRVTTIPRPLFIWRVRNV